jgi:hypothetical protein
MPVKGAGARWPRPAKSGNFVSEKRRACQPTAYSFQWLLRISRPWPDRRDPESHDELDYHFLLTRNLELLGAEDDSDLAGQASEVERMLTGLWQKLTADR